MCFNIWLYDFVSGENKQIICFKDFDIFWMLVGFNDLIFEVGGIFYLMDLVIEKYVLVNINVVSDFFVEMVRVVDVSDWISGMIVVFGGKWVVFEVCGEFFDVFVKEGFIINLIQFSGVFD